MNTLDKECIIKLLDTVPPFCQVKIVVRQGEVQPVVEVVETRRIKPDKRQ